MQKPSIANIGVRHCGTNIKHLTTIIFLTHRGWFLDLGKCTIHGSYGYRTKTEAYTAVYKSTHLQYRH